MRVRTSVAPVGTLWKRPTSRSPERGCVVLATPREGHVAYPWGWGHSFKQFGRSAGVCYGVVMVVPSPVAVMENVPAVLDV